MCCDTGERLTQPGKLAIIYTQPHQEKEYINYINRITTTKYFKT